MNASRIERYEHFFACESCGGVAFGREPAATCCETAMTRIDPGAIDVPETPLEQILPLVFGLSPTGIELVRWLLNHEEARVSEMAEAHPYDRTTVSRHLARLHELGLVERRKTTPTGGGRVFVYTTRSREHVRRQVRAAMVAWMADVLSRMEATVSA